MKAAFVRLGIRGFNPKLRNAPERLAALPTPEYSPIPPNTLAELQREMVHLRFINQQIKQIEDARQTKTSHGKDQTPRSWNCNASVGSALRQRTCLCVRCSRATYGTDGRSPFCRAHRFPLTRVDRDGKRFSPKRATRGHRQVVRRTASWFENRLGNGLVEARGHAATACSIASSHVENACLRAAR